MSLRVALRSFLVAAFIATPGLLYAGTAQVKEALGCQVAGNCGGKAETLDACSNTHLGAQNKPEIAQSGPGTSEDACKGMPPGVCAACSGVNEGSALCLEARAYYCGQLGWCSN